MVRQACNYLALQLYTAGLRVQGAVEMVTSGGYDVAYCLTLTDHATSAMHEHAVDMLGLHWLGRRARLRALRLCHSAAGAPWHSRSAP